MPKHIVYVKPGKGYEQKEIKIEDEAESRAVIAGLRHGTSVAMIDPTLPRKQGSANNSRRSDTLNVQEIGKHITARPRLRSWLPTALILRWFLYVVDDVVLHRSLLRLQFETKLFLQSVEERWTIQEARG